MLNEGNKQSDLSLFFLMNFSIFMGIKKKKKKHRFPEEAN